MPFIFIENYLQMRFSLLLFFQPILYECRFPFCTKTPAVLHVFPERGGLISQVIPFVCSSVVHQLPQSSFLNEFQRIFDLVAHQNLLSLNQDVIFASTTLMACEFHHPLYYFWEKLIELV